MSSTYRWQKYSFDSLGSGEKEKKNKKYGALADRQRFILLD